MRHTLVWSLISQEIRFHRRRGSCPAVLLHGTFYITIDMHDTGNPSQSCAPLTSRYNITCPRLPSVQIASGSGRVDLSYLVDQRSSKT